MRGRQLIRDEWSRMDWEQWWPGQIILNLKAQPILRMVAPCTRSPHSYRNQKSGFWYKTSSFLTITNQFQTGKDIVLNKTSVGCQLVAPVFFLSTTVFPASFLMCSFPITFFSPKYSSLKNTEKVKTWNKETRCY